MSDLTANLTTTTGINAEIGGYHSRYQLIYNSFDIKPSLSVAAVQNNAVTSLVKNGLWPKIKSIYFQTPSNEQASRINWKDPTDNTLVKQLSTSYNNTLGFKGNSADSSYMDMDFNPSVDGDGIYTNDEASIFAYVNTEVDEDHAFIFGWSTGGSLLEPATGVVRRYYQWQGKINNGDGGFTEIWMSGRNLGFVTFVRIDNDTIESYFNGVLQNIETGLTNGTNLPNNQFQALRNANGNNPTDSGFGCLGYGAKLSQSEVFILYNIVETYLASVGADESWKTDTLADFDFEEDNVEHRGHFQTTGSPNLYYTASPLIGMGSALINTSDSAIINFPVYRDLVNVSFVIKFTDARPASRESFFSLRNGSTTILNMALQSDGKIMFHHGTVNQVTTAILNTDTIYYIWADYTKGTGADGLANLYISTTSTKPGTANLTINNGTGTTNVNGGRFYSGSDLANYIFDDLLIQ